MLTIDTHYRDSESWFEPIDLLLFHKGRTVVDKAVLAQHRGEWDNCRIIECVRRLPGRFVAIGAIDVTAARCRGDARDLASHHDHRDPPLQRAQRQPAPPDDRGLSHPFLHVGRRGQSLRRRYVGRQRGETVALVGESGSGKSVSALPVMRLIPEPPGHSTRMISACSLPGLGLGGYRRFGITSRPNPSIKSLAPWTPVTGMATLSTPVASMASSCSRIC